MMMMMLNIFNIINIEASRVLANGPPRQVQTKKTEEKLD